MLSTGGCPCNSYMESTSVFKPASKVAQAAYPNNEAPDTISDSSGDWHLVDKHVLRYQEGNIFVDGDGMVLYRRHEDGACILSFAGTTAVHVSEFFTNVNMVPRHRCGAYVHLGFSRELERYLQSEEWESLMGSINSCCCLVATGHSLGGALASIFTQCANNQDNGAPYEINGQNPLSGLTVNALYTFGTPRVSWINRISNGGDCIPGYRFHNYAWWTLSWFVPMLSEDAVPGQPAAFEHPILKTIRIDHEEVESGWAGAAIASTSSVRRRRFSCLSGARLSTYPDLNRHELQEYVAALYHLW